MAPYEAVGCISENSETQNQSAHFTTYTHTHSTQRYVMQILLPSSVTLTNCSLATTLFNAQTYTYTTYRINYTDLYPKILLFTVYFHFLRMTLIKTDGVFLISVVLSANLSTFPTWPLSIRGQMSRILMSNSVMWMRGALTYTSTPNQRHNNSEKSINVLLQNQDNKMRFFILCTVWLVQ